MTTTRSGDQGGDPSAPDHGGLRSSIAAAAWNVVFYGLILPVGVVCRALGLGRFEPKLDRRAATYWRQRRDR